MAAAGGDGRVAARRAAPNPGGAADRWSGQGAAGKVADTAGEASPHPHPSRRAAADAGSTDMAKGKRKLEVVHLVCEETGDFNYTLRRKTGGEKLKVKKYSPRLRKHTLHNEKRK